MKLSVFNPSMLLIGVHNLWPILHGFREMTGTHRRQMTDSLWLGHLIIIIIIIIITRTTIDKLIFIARQHAMHAERDTVMAHTSVCPSVCPMPVLSLSDLEGRDTRGQIFLADLDNYSRTV